MENATPFILAYGPVIILSGTVVVVLTTIVIQIINHRYLRRARTIEFLLGSEQKDCTLPANLSAKVTGDGFLNLTKNDKDGWNALAKMMNAYEGLACATREGIFDPKVVKSLMGPSMSTTYLMVYPMVAKRRIRRKFPELWTDVEHLAYGWMTVSQRRSFEELRKLAMNSADPNDP